MSTSDHIIHIQLEATVTIEENTPTLCNLAINPSEQNIAINKNADIQNKTNAKEALEDKSDCEKTLTSNSKQETEQRDDINQFVVISDIIPLPDELVEDTQDDKSVKENLISNTISTPSTSKSSKDDLSGGGSKPISTKQKSLIQTMATEQGKDAEYVANSLCNKSLDQLEGREADAVIKSLRKKRR